MTTWPLMLALTALAGTVGCGDGANGSETEVGSDPAEATSTTSSDSSTSMPDAVTSATSAPASPTTTTSTTTTTLAPPVIQSDIVATYTPAPAPAGSLVVHDESSVFVVDLAVDPVESQIVLGPLDDLVVQAARLAGDGSLVVELIDDVAIGEAVTVHKIVQFGTNGSITDLIEDAVLFDLALFGGVEQVLVGEVWDGEDEAANLVAVPLDGRPPVAFGTAFAPEYGVGSIDVVNEVAMVSAYADLSELVSFTDAAGNDISRPSPTDDLEYGAEPAVSHATFSPDGSEVAWIEGPEYYPDADAEEATWHGAWRVRSFDVVTGEERLNLAFEFPDGDPFNQLVNGLAHRGDQMVISRGLIDDGSGSDLELLVLDLATEEPEWYELPVHGVADVVS